MQNVHFQFVCTHVINTQLTFSHLKCRTVLCRKKRHEFVFDTASAPPPPPPHVSGFLFLPLGVGVGGG